jgi:hypothetical protein
MAYRLNTVILFGMLFVCGAVTLAQQNADIRCSIEFDKVGYCFNEKVFLHLRIFNNSSRKIIASYYLDTKSTLLSGPNRISTKHDGANPIVLYCADCVSLRKWLLPGQAISHFMVGSFSQSDANWMQVAIPLGEYLLIFPIKFIDEDSGDDISEQIVLEKPIYADSICGTEISQDFLINYSQSLWRPKDSAASRNFTHLLLKGNDYPFRNTFAYNSFMIPYLRDRR